MLLHMKLVLGQAELPLVSGIVARDTDYLQVVLTRSPGPMEPWVRSTSQMMMRTFLQASPIVATTQRMPWLRS